MTQFSFPWSRVWRVMFSGWLATAALMLHSVSAATNDMPIEAQSNSAPARFTLKIPAGWTNLLKEQIAALEGEPSGKPGPSRTSVGYTVVGAQGLIPTPLIFVQDIGYRRIPEQVLNMLANESLREMALRDHIRPDGFEAADILETDYDTNRHVLTVTLERHDPVLGRMREIDHIHYAERGSITLTCAARPEDFSTWTNVFAETLASFRLAPELQYRVRPESALQPVEMAQSALKARLFFFGIATFGPIIGWFLKRRFCEVRSDEI